MDRIGASKRVLLPVLLLIAGSILLFAGVVPRKGDCYIKCSPVIAVTNYPYFSALLKSLIQDRFISELKLCLCEKLNLAFLPGNFRALDANLRKATNPSPLVESLVKDGLGSQLAFVRTQMSVEVFAARLNKAVLAALYRELKQLGCHEDQVREVLSDYRKEFLNSSRAVGTYADQAKEFQTMTAEFLPVSSRLLSNMTALGTKMDVAEGVQRRPGGEITGNTRQILDECGVHTRSGLRNIAGAAEISLADSISRGFCSASDGYLAARLERIRDLKDKGVLSSRDVGRIVETVDNAAAGVPPEYIQATTATLEDMTAGIRASLNRKMNDSVTSAISVINRVVSLEKEKERFVTCLYGGIEKEVKGLLGDTNRLAAVAREKGGLSLVDEKSIRKAAILLAGRNSSMLRKRLAAKHYITALMSLETAAVIRVFLSGFDPAALDRGYEDIAWKDLARFNYYLLRMDNQMLRLLALRAMTESLSTEDPDVSRYAEDGGLPEGF